MIQLRPGNPLHASENSPVGLGSTREKLFRDHRIFCSYDAPLSSPSFPYSQYSDSLTRYDQNRRHHLPVSTTVDNKLTTLHTAPLLKLFLDPPLIAPSLLEAKKHQQVSTWFRERRNVTFFWFAFQEALVAGLEAHMRCWGSNLGRPRARFYPLYYFCSGPAAMPLLRRVWNITSVPVSQKAESPRIPLLIREWY